MRGLASKLVGRTPRSAAGPLAGLFTHRRRADEGVGRGPGGPPHKSGQATVEFALLYAGVALPLTFMIVFVSEMLWVWHSVADFTRDGARYAATHCWMADGSNVAGPGGYMPTHVPPMIDMDQFQTGAAGIQVQYWQADPATGALTPFSCSSGDCSAGCVPDAVTVSITNYRFTRFSGFFKLPAVSIPPFTTSVPMESAGCDESGNCLP